MSARETHLGRALRLSALSIVWSGVVGSIATYAALASGSLSLLGFGVDAVIDSVASMVLIWRFRVETRNPEQAERVEHMAERVVGLALIALALYLAVGAIRSLAGQTHPESSLLSLVLLLASAVVLPPLALAKYRVAAELRSGALRLDSILTAVAAVLAAISLASLASSEAFGFWWADAIGALVVAGITVREGIGSIGASHSHM
jgi:divalent metal cation (Fe/Co/Zn/Cd) transporter